MEINTGKNKSEEALLAEYGIVLKDGKFFLNELSFSSLESAVSFAKLKRGHAALQDINGGSVS